jgi:site-specific recombinase XerD
VLSLGHMPNSTQANNYPTVQHAHALVPAADLTITVEAFLRALVGKNRSPQTLRAYRADLGQFLAWLADTNDVARHPGQITRADVEAYLTNLGHRGLTGVSRARKLAALRGYFTFLVNHEVIPRSPAAGVDAPRRERRSRPFLRPEEYNQLLSLAGAHPRDFAILQVFLQTGLRVSELVHLSLTDIDPPGRMLTVRGAQVLACGSSIQSVRDGVS